MQKILACLSKLRNTIQSVAASREGAPYPTLVETSVWMDWRKRKRKRERGGGRKESYLTYLVGRQGFGKRKGDGTPIYFPVHVIAIFTQVLSPNSGRMRGVKDMLVILKYTNL